jgi:hypothetical protein
MLVTYPIISFFCLYCSYFFAASLHRIVSLFVTLDSMDFSTSCLRGFSRAYLTRSLTSAHSVFLTVFFATSSTDFVGPAVHRTYSSFFVLLVTPSGQFRLHYRPRTFSENCILLDWMISWHDSTTSFAGVISTTSLSIGELNTNSCRSKTSCMLSRHVRVAMPRKPASCYGINTS